MRFSQKKKKKNDLGQFFANLTILFNGLVILFDQIKKQQQMFHICSKGFYNFIDKNMDR